MKKQKSNIPSNIGLVFGWPFFSSVILFLLSVPIYSLLNIINTYDIIPHGFIGIMVIVGHVVAFLLSYRIISRIIKGRVSMAAFYTAMIITILMQIFWRYMMFSWTRFACGENCVATVLNYEIDGFAVIATIFILIISGVYLNQKIESP
jgi:hypothetical protein